MLVMPQVALAELQPGDIAIIRVKGGGTQTSFSWVALRDIDSADLKWTDASWGTNFDGDGNPYGWTYENIGFDMPDTIKAGTVGEVPALSRLGTLNTPDQIFFFTGVGATSGVVETEESANFIWGITWGSDTNTWLEVGSGAVATSALSYQPVSLRNLGMSTALGSGSQWYYAGPLTGTVESLQAAIADANNWAPTSGEETWAAIRSDAFQVVVPEPSTYAGILSLTCLGFAANRRRRNK